MVEPLDETWAALLAALSAAASVCSSALNSVDASVEKKDNARAAMREIESVALMAELSVARWVDEKVER